MYRRALGRTGLQVAEIGYGAWGIGDSGWRGAQDDESVRALHRAIDLGVSFIDTALGYGDGHSERLVGQVVRARPEEIVVASKVPPANETWPAPKGIDPDEAFPANHVRACVEQSLDNLGLERLDLAQFHVWSDDWLGRGSWQQAIEELKREGLIGHFGVSVNDHEPANGLQLVESGIVDTVQVIYNVFDQSPEDELLPACRRRRVGVIARVPLDEGGLTGRIGPDTEFDADDFRAAYFRDDRKAQVWERTQAICDDLGIERADLPEVALRFALSHPAVSTVIPGMRSVRNVERNCAVADGRGLPGEQIRRLRAHRWVRNFYA
jgi:aryl-alcohol dehydrogenase-like predicted oxidoreductase